MELPAAKHRTALAFARAVALKLRWTGWREAGKPRKSKSLPSTEKVRSVVVHFRCKCPINFRNL